MQFISKFKYKRKGHHIVKAFIRECWNKSEQMYMNLDYDGLKRSKKMQRLLLKEQSGFCCYCMREIPLGEVTLEHVIPRKLENKTLVEDIKFYRRYGRLKRVCYVPKIRVTPKLCTPPYPHCIAYENLTASCKGRVFNGSGEYQLHQCCNNFRGNDRIIPLFFIQSIGKLINYETDGRLSYCDSHDSSIKSLNLQHPTLKLMRKVWAKIVLHHIGINQVREAKADEVVRINIIDDIDIERPERQNMRKDLYWKLLLEFHWFYCYFTKRFVA